MCFIKARRLRPCLLYTPPVAPTDLDVLVSCSDWQPLGRREVLRTPMSGGRRSRNKAAVGEPAAGSLVPTLVSAQLQTTITNKNLTSNSGSLGLDIDEERRTERNWWRRASALCELSILEYLRQQCRVRYRVGLAGREPPGLQKQNYLTCAARDHGPNLSISVSPGKEIKTRFPQ